MTVCSHKIAHPVCISKQIEDYFGRIQQLFHVIGHQELLPIFFCELFTLLYLCNGCSISGKTINQFPHFPLELARTFPFEQAKNQVVEFIFVFDHVHENLDSFMLVIKVILLNFPNINWWAFDRIAHCIDWKILLFIKSYLSLHAHIVHGEGTFYLEGLHYQLS